MTTTMPTPASSSAPTPSSGSTSTTPEPPRGSLVRRFVRGRPQDPAWVRPALFTLLAVTAVLYLWDLGASGYANSFYSAAVQAGTKSWKAFFFGSSDAANSITVDKPPASLWVMEISARIFGVNAWSILVPQALEGVATVALLYATIRRWFSPVAGLLAGAVLALTPVAVLMFRFNNPDALLVLLMTAAAYALTRALEKGQTSWLLLVGGLIGTAFLAKMLQAFLVVPGFALVYLIAAPPAFLKRVWQLCLSGLVLLVSAGWWVAAVQLTPAADRPFVGGSQHNSELELIFGYNGFGRLTGNETGSVTGGGGGTAGGGGGGGGSMWGKTGWSRLFGSDMGGQISWLLPAALILLAAGLFVTLRANRTNRLRAALILWGGWLLVTAATFSFGQGIIHPYYTVALAPAIGALVGIGGVEMWQRRDSWFARIVLAVAIGFSGWWAHVLLGRSPKFESWLAPTVLVAGIATAVLVVLLPLVKRAGRRVAPVVGLVAVLTAVGGPTAYAIDTTSTPHSGSIPSAGPTVSGGSGFGGQRGGGGGGFGGGPGGAGRQRTGTTGNAGATGGFGGGPGNFAGGQGGGTPPTGTAGAPPTGTAGGTTGTAGGTTGTAGATTGAGRGGFGGAGGGTGGLLNSSAPTAALVKVLKADASSYTWVAAAIGSNTASGYQLATGDSVMPIGGFNGTDPSPTLAQFEKLVKAGKIHYFIGSGGLGAGNGGSNDSSAISTWVESHYTATTVGGVTLYDLTKPTATS
jgi:4-amino-4-deoxy-L-arabinose transferase-like glycosyltransferase